MVKYLIEGDYNVLAVCCNIGYVRFYKSNFKILEHNY